MTNVTLDILNDWKEVKVDAAKKRHKLFFFVDRLLKIYDNGYFAYFKTGKTLKLKAVVSPTEYKEVSFDGKDKIKIVTKSDKTFIFKFINKNQAQGWHDALLEIISMSTSR